MHFPYHRVVFNKFFFKKSGKLSSNFVFCVFVFVLFFTQAAKRGILAPGRGRGLFTRGRGTARGRGSRGRGRCAPVHAVVDHRPRALAISGFVDSDRVDLLPHFAVSQVPAWFKKKKTLLKFMSTDKPQRPLMERRSRRLCFHCWCEQLW